MKRIKALTCLLLTMILAFNALCLSVGASEEAKSEVTLYAENVLSSYLNANGLFSSDYKLSKPIALQDWNGGQNNRILFLVFDNNRVVGNIFADKYEGQWYSSFNTANLEILNEVFINNTPVAFGLYNECFVMRTESEDILLSLSNEYDPLAGLSDNASTEDLTTISIDYSTHATTAIMPLTMSYNKQLAVTRVANANIGNGICWAACIASKVNYQKKSYLSAENVYYDIAGRYSEYNGAPGGGNECIVRGYNIYGVSVTETSRMGANEIYNILSSGKPLDIIIDKTGGAHSVLITGISYLDTSGTGGTLTLMDPNVASLVTINVQPSVIHNGGSGFVYASNSGTYTSWRDTRY